MRRTTTSRTIHGRLAPAVMAIALLAGVAAACTPTTTAPPTPTVIQKMTDAQADARLAELAPTIQQNLKDPAVLRNIPADELPQIQQYAAGLSSPTTRAAIIRNLRAIAASPPTLPTQSESFAGGQVGGGSGATRSIAQQVPITGVRSPRPPAAPASATNVPEPGPTSGACNAPNGTSTTVTAPPDVAPGQLLTPRHDVFATSSAGIAIGQDGPITPAGVEPVPGAGSGLGIQLRSAGLFGQEMLVRVNLDDHQDFGPRALIPLISIKPIGGLPSSEVRLNTNTVADAKIYCYANDAGRPDRGFWEGWVRIPRSEPGFQLIVEVVENDWYFQRVSYNPLLSPAGPQYFAGADRATIHVGATPITQMKPITHAIGVFATSGPDATTRSPNVLTETDGATGNDIEEALKVIVSSKIHSAVEDESGDFLWGSYPLGAYLDSVDNVNPVIDLRYVGSDQFSQPDEPAGVTGALQGNIRMDGLVAHLTEWFLGAPCPGATISLNASAKANVWADGSQVGSPVDARIDVHSSFENADFSLASKLDWLDPACWMAYVVNSTPAYLFGPDAINSGVESAFNKGGDGEPGAVQKLIDGFDLSTQLPNLDLPPTTDPSGLSIGSDSMKPVVTSLDNAWCGSYLKPTGCTKNQDLLGTQGAEIAGDATLVSGSPLPTNYGQYPMVGKFRNVYEPTLLSKTEDLVTSHRDINGQLAGLGVVIDPGLINLALRHLSQGNGLSTTTTGLLDISGFKIPAAGLTITTHPEVAPMILGVPKPPLQNCDGNCTSTIPTPPSRTTAPLVVPDLRLSLSTGPGAPIQFSVAASVNAGLAFDPSTDGLGPALDTPLVDLLVTGGCQVDWNNAYYLSYTMCGRGGVNGTGGTFTISALINWIANQGVLPMIAASLGKVTLPSLDGIIPGFHAALSNVRFAQRGGYLAVYADLRTIPYVAIAIPPVQPGDTDIRFAIGAQTRDIDFSKKTDVIWEVTDHATGLAVATTGVPGTELTLPSTGSDMVRAPLAAFQQTTGESGPQKVVDVKLTIRQSDLSASATASFTWHPPSPPNPCNPLGTGFSLRAAVNNGGGGGGSTCP